MDKVSSYGFAAGYVGGSTTPFILPILLIQFGPELLGIDSALGVKLSVVMTSGWWGLFFVPILKNVKQRYYIERPDNHMGRDVFSNLRKTFAAICHSKALIQFMIAYFFYIDGVAPLRQEGRFFSDRRSC